MQLVRPFVLQIMMHTCTCNMQFKACHIQGKFNCKADAISRKQFKTFKQLEPDADHQPMTIPIFFRTDDLGNEVGRLIESSITENTREAYINGLNCFDQIRESYGLEVVWQPLLSHVAICISCLSLSKKSLIYQQLPFLVRLHIMKGLQIIC